MSGIYIHIPFCKQKCHYCDFHFSVSLRHKKEFILALLKEIQLRKSLDQKIDTIYFGGGTPSLLDEKELNLIMNEIYKNFSIHENPEITLEANPDDLSVEKLKIVKNANINRLSIGVQSFHDDELHLMNRSHTANEAINAIENAQNIGFQNIFVTLLLKVVYRFRIKTLL